MLKVQYTRELKIHDRKRWYAALLSEVVKLQLLPQALHITLKRKPSNTEMGYCYYRVAAAFEKGGTS